jgi:D-lactate dehydrogenase
MALLEPDVTRIGRPPGEPFADRVPDHLAAGTPEPLRSRLHAAFGPGRVLDRVSDIVRYASDASPYRKLPQAVLMAHDAADVAKAFAFGREHAIPVTLRSGGTSLNGQGQTDGLLVDVRRHFSGTRVEDGGARARVKPGTVLGHANRVLARHGVKLGPDPASTDVATVGGVVANNSGGMRCGVTADSYSTVRALSFVLPSGTAIDTESPDAEQRFAEAEPALAQGLLDIRDELRADAALAERIRRKFAIKNTTGYRLCAFLDADTPLEIFRRLLIGSEGTLAFVSEVVFETVPLPAHTTVSWLHFPSIDAACAPVPDFVAAGARAVELMGAPALVTAAWQRPGLPEHWKEIPIDSAVLLVEFGADTLEDLDPLVQRAHEIVDGQLIRDPEFVYDTHAIELAWSVREGMFGLVGRLRPEGSALMIEDVCVEPARFAESAADVSALLAEHGFLTGVAGHASAGNMHFMLTPDLNKPEDVDRYETFMGKLVDLVVDKYDGSLKAEHGTGLNMAPYVEREWGEKATAMMWRVKALADPDAVLNPGVMLNRDPGVHLRDLQSTPPIEEEATICVECGFCEPVCPSRNVTTTPRQRIVLRREMARQPEGSPVFDALMAEYDYDAIQTCAADGTCVNACPVAIDTGKLMKRFRAAEHTDRGEATALRAAQQWGRVEQAARAGLRAGSALPDGVVASAAGAARRVLGAELVPAWPGDMPEPAPAQLPATRREGAAAVYLPACINRIFGRPHGAPDELTGPEALVAVSARAGLPLWIPEDVSGHCCGTPWSSKGFARGHAHMAAKVSAALARWSDGGALPVVVDATSCTHGLLQEVAPEGVEILDAIDWAHDRLLPQLSVASRCDEVVVHPTCSAGHLGVQGKLEALLGALAEEVVVPDGTTCCGMAGDRGLLHPELPASALRDVATELAGRGAAPCVSSNRTCELALEQNTGRPYSGFAVLLERATR